MSDSFLRGHEMIAEGELRQLFAARKPDAARFAAGVAQRLQNANGARRRTLLSSPPRWLDRAASVLPGVPDGGFFAKSWATLLSLPALLLLAAFAVFVRSNKKLAATLDASSPDSTMPRARVVPRQSWYRPRGLLMACGSLLGVVLLALGTSFGGSVVINTVTLVLLVSMAALTYQIGTFARVRSVMVQETGRFVVTLQSATWFGCVAWVQSIGVFDADSALGYVATGWVLCGGVLATGVATSILGRTCFSPAMWIALFSLLPAALVLGSPYNSAAAVRQRLAAIDLDLTDIGGWDIAGQIVHALEACGERTIDLSAASARIERAIEDGTKAHPQVWTAAARMGLVDDEHWRLLAARPTEAYALKTLLEGDRPLGMRYYQRYLLSMLFATRELTAADRDRLASRIDASWPEPDGVFKIHELDEARLYVEWLEQLGRRDLVLAKTPWLHALLRRHWVGEAEAAKFSFPGGFTAMPEVAHADIGTTSTALAIVERVGAPPEIPLPHLRAFLRHNAKSGLLSFVVGEAVLSKLARADHYLLVNGIGLPARGPLQMLIDERTFIAALLLALLGLRAVWLANRLATPLTGALP